jgi:predicted 3-demethylubiquinone-9 3-methyltransferase (glyoxalase superfamily)
MRGIVPCLWFDDQAEEAANFYTSLFPDSNVLSVARYTDAGPGAAGQAMTVSFQLLGNEYLALNGGPVFSFNEAISFQVFCSNQEEVDRYWAALCEGGRESDCGWVKDRFGLSWQVVPEVLPELLGGEDRERAARVMSVMMQMRKLDIAALLSA